MTDQICQLCVYFHFVPFANILNTIAKIAATDFFILYFSDEILEERPKECYNKYVINLYPGNGSVVECSLGVRETAGSIPASPTISIV